MEHEFWHNAWAKSDKPGWQQDTANTALVEHWQADGSTVFVPLCGRSPDLAWLQQQGHQVIGVDLSESAIRRFLESREIDFSVEQVGEFQAYRAPGYALYAGDYFALPAEHLKGVTRVYDRAALVALPGGMRFEYADYLQRIVPDNAEIFIILIDYDQSLMKGPPFSVPESELRLYYGDRYRIEVIKQENGNLKRRGVDHLVETTYRLTPA